jgi:hypothetical protein
LRCAAVSESVPALGGRDHPLAVDLLRKLNTLMVIVLLLDPIFVSCGPSSEVEHIDSWLCRACILQRDSHMTAFCGLVDTGDFLPGRRELLPYTCAYCLWSGPTGFYPDVLPFKRPASPRFASVLYVRPLEWCVLRWHPVATCKDNHPYITTCLSSVNSLFRHLDHASIINPPPKLQLSTTKRNYKI